MAGAAPGGHAVLRKRGKAQTIVKDIFSAVSVANLCFFARARDIVAVAWGCRTHVARLSGTWVCGARCPRERETAGG